MPHSKRLRKVVGNIKDKPPDSDQEHPFALARMAPEWPSQATAHAVLVDAALLGDGTCASRDTYGSARGASSGTERVGSMTNRVWTPSAEQTLSDTACPLLDIKTALEPGEKRVILIPVIHTAPGAFATLVASSSMSHLFGVKLAEEGRAHKTAHGLANELAEALRGRPMCTFLAFQNPERDTLVFALPISEPFDTPACFHVCPFRTLQGELRFWSFLALHAVQSLLPRTDEQAESWEEAQRLMLGEAGGSGATGAHRLHKGYVPSGVVQQQVRNAVGVANIADELLRRALCLEARRCSATVSSSLLDWSDSIRPIPWHDLPSDLHLEMDTFREELLAVTPFPNPCPPARTEWMSRRPAQEAPEGFHPTQLSDLLTVEAIERVDGWMQEQLEFLRDIELHGLAAERKSNRALALGQDCFLPPARGVVWDLRGMASGIIRPVDFAEPISTHLNTELLCTELGDHPDQELLSFLVEGVRYKADLELQVVLLPHLISLRGGYRSLQDEVAKYHRAGWYGLFKHPPFLPFRAVPKGSVPRKLEPERPRPTTEAGAPRKLLLDTSGRPVISLNAASSGLPPEQQADWMPSEGVQVSQWPTENKPRVSHLLTAVAVLLHAAHVLKEPIYIVADDFKNFFNQLRLAPEEWWKCGMVLSDPEGPIFATEYIMTFGLRPASNIAQRFADAILLVFRRRLAQVEDPFSRKLAEDNFWFREWRERRSAYGAQGDDRIWQAQLFACYIYTDDPALVVVGAERMARALRVWTELTQEVRLIMALPDKRQCGSHAHWLGAGILAPLGLAWITPEKRLSALANLIRVLDGSCLVSDYHALLGLLEHLSFLSSWGRTCMLGLWSPFRRGYTPDPNTVVLPTPLMRRSCKRWIDTLLTRAASSAMRSVTDTAPTRMRLTFTIYSDAHTDARTAGLGGWCHGFWWHRRMGAEVARVPIAVLELIATVVSFFTFSTLFPVGQVDQTLLPLLHLRSDALATPCDLVRGAAGSDLMEEVLTDLTQHPTFEAWRGHLFVSHVYGVGNELADAASRGDFERLGRLAVQLGVKPMELPPSLMVDTLIANVMRYLTRVEMAVDEANANTPTKASFLKLRMDRTVRVALPMRTQSVVSCTKRLRLGSRHNATPPPLLHGPSMMHRTLRVCQGAKRPSGTSSQLARPGAISRAVPLSERPSAGPAPQTAPRTLPVIRPLSNAQRVLPSYSPGPAFKAALSHLQDLRTEGYRASTTRIEEGHWKYWVRFCHTHSISMWRDDHAANAGLDRVGYQEEIDILAAFLVDVLASMPSRSPRPAPLPSSALNVVRGVARIHRKQSPPIHMVPIGEILPIVRGLNNRYRSKHAYQMLLPRRKQPWRRSWVRAMCALRTKPGVMLDGEIVVGSLKWVSYFALLETLLQTGMRKSEVAVGSKGNFDPKLHLTRASLLWCINGAIIASPSREELLGLAETDYAILQPPPSKTDFFGVVWGDKPIYLPVRFHAAICAALRLRDLELLCPIEGRPRAESPLFLQNEKTPFTFHRLVTILDDIKALVLPADVDPALYTYHSCRIFLATALGAAKCSDQEIQAICRWQTVESLRIYNRMQPGTYAHLLDLAEDAVITSYDVTSLAVVTSAQISERVSVLP